MIAKVLCHNSSPQLGDVLPTKLDDDIFLIYSSNLIPP
jgi:hypothetical protein